MKKGLLRLLALGLVLISLLGGCVAPKKTKIVHCDRCGKEVKIAEDSQMNDEEWIIYCDDCAKEAGVDDIVPAQ